MRQSEIHIMSISSKMLLGTPPAGNKTNPLLAALSTDLGAGTRVGPDFSEMLKSTFIAPTVTPMRSSEIAATPAPKEAAPRTPETARNKEQKPAAAQAQRASEPAVPKAGNDESQASDSTAASQAADTSDASQQSEDSLEAKAAEQTEGAEAPKAKKDKRLDQSVEAEDPRGLGIAAIAISLADPKSAAPADARQPDVTADKPAAEASRPQDLASLMPSVAKAVFGQDPGKPAVGEVKSDNQAAPTSTDERGKVMAAKAQDTAALLTAQNVSADTAAKEISATSPDLLKSFVADKAVRGEQPGFGKLMQAANAVTAPFNAPVNAAAPGAQGSAAATPVPIKSDIHGPAFAPEMAARLTVLTSAGVQKAELHLNPAEMGPVSVQIQLNGQEAQVNFHAQHALTREVLERSLPELAAALRDAGMTLTGGGVFQQSNGARQDAQAQPAQPASHGMSPTALDLEADVAAPSTIRHTQVGVLDMYV